MIKKLLKSVREYKKYAIATPIIVAIDVVIEILIPFLVAKLIDNGIEARNIGYIWKIGIILSATALTALALGVLHGKTAAKASTGFAKNLRKDMYYRIQNYSFANIDKFSTSSLVTRLTTDVTNVQNSFQMLTRIAIRAPLMIIFALTMVIGINSKLALVYLAIVPVLVIGLTLIAIKAFPIFEKVFKTYDNLNNVVQENVRGIRVVKSYVLEDEENEKFNKVSNTIYKLFSKAEKTVALNAPLMQFAMYGGILLLSWFSTKFIIAGDMTTGELTSVISYSTQILISLMMLSMTFVMIIMSKASAERIVEVLNEESDIHNHENPIYKVETGDVEFKNVNFSYVNDENKICLKDVNLKIESGETVGIIGGTGSSKTTLVQLIPRLYDTTTGEVLVGGNNVKQYDIESLRNEVSMVLQKNVLFSGTIKENLRWGNKEATDEEIVRVCKLAQADEFINQFPNKYDTYIEQGGTNVSGGQKQRLCIARALLKKPKILILDDSTSAVDTKTDSLIRKAFKEEIPNTTKFIIAQRISSIEDADKIIVMDNGKINAVGTHEQLLKENEIYKEVYYSQNKGGMTDEV
ncbi:MAG: ABC transporter ATP-binding protein [Clostridia bacterium]|nr:ABC transporter ATP-binding protein [Clostridia bacterium]